MVWIIRKFSFSLSLVKVGIFLVCLAIISFGCKKGRVCECTTTWTFQYSNGSGYDTRIYPSDASPYTKGLTKKQALRACDNQRATINLSFTDLITDHGSDPLKPGEKIETECILH
jgi:hypothetical protein